MDKSREASRKRRGVDPPEEKRFVGRYMTKMLASSSGRLVVMMKYCDRCDGGILEGFYYHCSVCSDYDLCVDCEKDNDRLIKKGEEPIHNPDHIMIKYRA